MQNLVDTVLDKAYDKLQAELAAKLGACDIGCQGLTGGWTKRRVDDACKILIVKANMPSGGPALIDNVYTADCPSLTGEAIKGLLEGPCQKLGELLGDMHKACFSHAHAMLLSCQVGCCIALPKWNE